MRLHGQTSARTSDNDSLEPSSLFPLPSSLFPLPAADGDRADFFFSDRLKDPQDTRAGTRCGVFRETANPLTRGELPCQN